LDTNTGLQNNWNRWYESVVGQWASKDPIGFNGYQTNIYVYCGNSPMNATDPSGLQDPGYMGIGTMGDSIREAEARELKSRIAAIKQKMREAMKKATVNLSAEEQAEALADLEKLFSVADKTMSGRKRNVCGDWMNTLIGTAPNSKYFKIEPVGFDYPIGIPGTDCYIGHNAVKVTLYGGAVFYLDGGWWGHYFTPEDIPWYMTPVDPHSPKKWIPWSE
jgi:RHS repeat-associated protein